MNRPSHIVIDAREYTTSTGRYMFRLIQYLEKIDNEHDYTVLLKPHDMDVYEFTNPRFKKLACPFKEFTFEEQIGLLKQINGLKADLVHFGKDHQPVLYRGKVVTTMHDLTTTRFRNPAKSWLFYAVKQPIYRFVVRHVARKSNAIITPTQFVKDDMVRFTRCDPDKITVTHESADKITDSPEPVKELVGKQFIMYLGRPTPHKNLGRLIDAFALLKKSYPELQLVLAGKKDALYERHEAEAANKGIADIVFTGFVSEGQLRWLYENCSAYVFPSLSEGFGLPALEAMRHSAPVASSNATCLPEVYGEAAHYFNPLDVRDIAAKISDVIDDPKLRSQLIEKGKQQAEKYSWKRMAEQTLAVYKSVLGES
jgi:glycosyltransferase involved in cell wall biosynthesis